MGSTPDGEARNAAHCISLVIWINGSLYIKAVNQELLSMKMWNKFLHKKQENEAKKVLRF